LARPGVEAPLITDGQQGGWSMEEQNNRNLILAMVLSALVMVVWFVLFPPPEPTVIPPTETAAGAAGDVATPTQTGAEPAATAVQTETAQAVADAPRLTIDTPELSGSISVIGGRIDDLSLKQYRETIDDTSPIVKLLKPAGETDAYYALNGWSPAGALGFDDVPGATTAWQVTGGDTLAPDKPVTLTWANQKGLTFTRTIAVDNHFMFTITDTVQNAGAEPAQLAAYGLLARHGQPKHMGGFSVVHEGVVRRTDGEYHETDYPKMPDLDVVEREGNPSELTPATRDGWIGFTDHYWQTVMIPEQGQAFTAVTKYVPASDVYQTEVRREVQTVAPGATITSTQRLFAGAKEWEAIRAYENQGFVDQQSASDTPIPGFIDSIDWGWFYFLTKPIFAVMHWLNGIIGNMGLAIIALTFFLKFLVLPLAYKSYVSMARMKELQPEMEALKERAGDDRQKMQREMMQLYKDKKVNPAAGCLPILLQIPIFFALYKVISVTIELRHAPFFGWLQDLSAPDTSSLFNAFGLMPWDAPAAGTVLHLVFIGILPILLGLTMWLQMKLNPAPTDPVQASIFGWMPWVFMFMMSTFASGLIVYWITNNTITFMQQYLIMWRHGKRPDIFGNIRSAKEARLAAKAPSPAGPAPKKGKK
jgi:YidC/Oxa1 family membrane protein insertase